MKNKKKIIILSIISALIICIISIFIIFVVSINKGYKYERHIALTRTDRVGGLIAYNINSDFIIDVPEEYFLNINDSDMTYDELVSEIGEPSGTIGSGIVRDYWRIGEDKYAVCVPFPDTLYFYICSGDE